MRRIARVAPAVTVSMAGLAWAFSAPPTQYEVGAGQTYKSPCALFAGRTCSPALVLAAALGEAQAPVAVVGRVA